MLPFSKRSRRCFYCQSFSPSQYHSKAPARWKCLKCEAVNFVDENGQPCDPPIEETAQELASSQNFTIPPPPETVTSYDGDQNDSLFCQTCQKNQFLIYETLANYLPDETDPSYASYEASYPAYRKEVEERFPPICKRCAPAAQHQINQAQYFAKSDYLRRLMEKKDYSFFLAWNWQQVMLAYGAAAHYASIAGQLIWDLMGMFSSPAAASFYTRDNMPSTPISCLSHTIRHRASPYECPTMLSPYAGWFLLIGWLSIWWNPLLAARMRKRHGKLIGLDSYYGIQLAVLVFRSYCWNILNNHILANYHPGVAPSVHVITAIVTIAGFFWSRHRLHLDLLAIFSAPNITEDTPVPAPASTPFQQPEREDAVPITPGIKADYIPRPPTRNGFPLDKLHTQTPQSAKTRSVYSFNPSEAGDDPDAMDWTPLPKPVELNVPSKRPPTPKYPVVGDPFRAGLQQQQDRYQSSVDANGGFSTKAYPGTLPSKSDQSKTPLAPPKFLPDDLQSVTGLESLFDKAFTIADGLDRLKTTTGTTEGATPTKQQTDEQAVRPKKIKVINVREVFFFCLRQASLILAFLTFVFPSAFQWPVRFGHITVLSVLAVIPGSWMFNSLRRSVESGNVVGTLLTFAHLLIWMGFLAGHIFLPEVIKDHMHLEKVDMVVISVMFGWEFQLSNLKAWLAPAIVEDRREVGGTDKAEEQRSQKTDKPPFEANPKELNEFNPNHYDRIPTPKPTPTPARGFAPEPPTLAPQAPQPSPAYTPAPMYAPTPEPIRREVHPNLIFNPQYSRRRAGSGHSMDQPRPRGLGPTPILQPPQPILRSSSPLRTVRQHTPSNSFPDPFNSVPRFPPPNESFSSLPENVLSPPRSPTISVTTAADTTIPDPPSPQYSRYAHSTGMTPDPFIEELNLNEDVDREETPVRSVRQRENSRYNFRKR